MEKGSLNDCYSVIHMHAHLPLHTHTHAHTHKHTHTLSLSLSLSLSLTDRQTERERDTHTHKRVTNSKNICCFHSSCVLQKIIISMVRFCVWLLLSCSDTHVISHKDKTQREKPLHLNRLITHLDAQSFWQLGIPSFFFHHRFNV